MGIFSPLHNGPFELKPYEVAWASEAIVYVSVDEVNGNAAPDCRSHLALWQRWQAMLTGLWRTHDGP